MVNESSVLESLKFYCGDLLTYGIELLLVQLIRELPDIYAGRSLNRDFWFLLGAISLHV